ncbi:MAG: tetraether lipid synthase Tes, partial [Promethearchaeota archaeon]
MFHVKNDPNFLKKYYSRTVSICPECLNQIPAEIIERDNQIFMIKTCKEHGYFEDIISSDADYYRWTHWKGATWGWEKDGEANPPDVPIVDPRGCPHNCGLCPEHLSTCSLALIDLTNRCNFNCNFCYANVRRTGYLVEPTLEEIGRVMDHFRNKPIPAIGIMFTGGEPTVRKDFPEICKMAKDKGFKEVIAATNGYLFQNKKNGAEMARKCREMGLDTLYLQFDGIHDETYIETRGRPLMAYKQRVIDNCREVGFDSIVLVATIVKDITDLEVGNIIQYAIDNIDICVGVIFQPVSLCGRVTHEDVRKLRITNADVIREIEKQTKGALRMDRDWYPLSTIVELGRTVAWLGDVEPAEFTCHPDCGFATYMILDPDENRMISLMDYLDPMKVIDYANKFWEKLKNRKPSSLFSDALSGIGDTGKDLGDIVDKSLTYLDRQQLRARFIAGILPLIKKPGKLMKVFTKMLMSGSWDTVSSFTYGSLLIGSMHFQDAYNFDTERAKRCIVHFGVAMPDGSVLESPFCVMNNFIREEVEKKIAKKYIQKGKEEWDIKEQSDKRVQNIQKASEIQSS